jgi:hypothetical protein
MELVSSNRSCKIRVILKILQIVVSTHFFYRCLLFSAAKETDFELE